MLTGSPEYTEINNDSRSSSDFDTEEYIFPATSAGDSEVPLESIGSVNIKTGAVKREVTKSSTGKSLYSFEINPSKRAKQKTRLLKKLKDLINEYIVRVGQQAIVLTVSPQELTSNYCVFGAKPLEQIIKNSKEFIMEELQCNLENQTVPEISDLFKLPPLIIDTDPVPLEKMTQAQLRQFVPLMLKYSCQRGKPGWGHNELKPPWWPKVLPWANVRMDERTEEEKRSLSWTNVLRQVVYNCYKYHGREDLLTSSATDCYETVAEQEETATIDNFVKKEDLPDDVKEDNVKELQVINENASIQVADNNVYEIIDQADFQIFNVTLNSEGQLILRGSYSEDDLLTVPMTFEVHQGESFLVNSSENTLCQKE